MRRHAARCPSSRERFHRKVHQEWEPLPLFFMPHVLQRMSSLSLLTECAFCHRESKAVPEDLLAGRLGNSIPLHLGANGNYSTGSDRQRCIERNGSAAILHVL